MGPEGNDRGKWVALAAPFWLGAAGVLVLDGAMGVQFLLYGKREGEEVVDAVRLTVEGEVKERGRGRWRRVRGWMKGWVPSPSPSPPPMAGVNDAEGVVVIEGGDRDGEEECLLQGEAAGERRGYGAA